MTYMDAIDGTLRKCLVNNATINSLIAARVYPAYHADIVKPVYPLICFSRLPSARDYRYNKRVTCQYAVYIYSEKGFNEIDRIYEAVKDTLDNEYFSLVGVMGRVGFRIVEHPTLDSEPDQQIYFSLLTVQAVAFFH